MATIPGILLLGGEGVQGGSVSNSPSSTVSTAEVLAGRAGGQFFDQSGVGRVVPADDSGDPSATTLSWWPWYDDTFGDVYVIGSATATTVTVSPDPGWTVDEWAGSKVSTSSLGLGLDNTRVAVISNTSDTLTVASWTTTPVVASSLWLDEGRFTDYAAMTAFRTAGESSSPTRGGGAYAQGGTGFGWDAGLLPLLWEEVFTSSPYFAFAKFAAAADTADYNAAGGQRTVAETWMAKVNAAFALRYPSDTVEWKYIILDYSTEDLDAFIAELPLFTQLASYDDDLNAQIAWLRGAAMANNADARVLLLNHDTTMREADATAAGAAINLVGAMHTGHALVAAADTDVRAVDLNGANLPLRNDSAYNYATDADKEFYAPQVYWRDGAKIISRAIELWEAGDGTASDGVMPVYILFGDSIETGEITPTYSTALDSDIYTATARDARQRIWNRTNQAVEAYDAHTNTQTSGTSTTSVGAHFSLTHKLMLRHPDTGFVLIQRGSSSSGLATSSAAYSAGSGGTWLSGVSGENWEEFNDDVANCYNAINVQFGRQAQLRAIIVGLGSNDAATAGGGASFADALDNFVAEMRDKWGHVVEGKATPIIWRVPQIGLANGMIYDEVIEIRNALTNKAADDPQFIAQNVDDLERKSDDIHETAAANVTRGERLDGEIAKIELPNCSVD